MEQIGRYRVVGELGRGAMGVVYRAEDPAIGRTVAIKTIRLGELTDPSERQFMRERLLREARSAGILSHPGIVTIYDISEEGDTAYVFMEFVNGETLDRLIHKSGGVDKERIFDVLRQTAAALDYAHGKGIVHRDIKPANIMISVDGAAKITDFGVAKILSQQMTQTRTVLGTPYYMSPEQIQGGQIDGRSDQFALAVVAYELMTGERPYSADSLPTLLFKIVKENAPPPHRINPSLAPEVARVFDKVFAKDPAERYGACTEFVSALAMAASRKPDWQPLSKGGAGEMATVVTEAPSPPPVPPPKEAVKPGPPPAEPVAERPEPPVLPPIPRTRRPEIEEEPASHLFRNVVLAALLLAGGGAGAWYFLGPDLGLPGGPSGQTEQTEGAATGAQDSPATADPAPPSTPGQSPPVPASDAIRMAQEAAEAAKPEPVPPVSEPPAAETPEPAPPRAPSKPAPPKAPRTHTLQIRSNPPNAQVSVDDNPQLACRTPCELEVEEGRHVIHVSIAGHRIGTRIIRVPDITDLTVNLERQAGTLAISTDPPGAAIYINGEVRPEKTPAMIKLPVGTYEVRLEVPGKAPVTERIEVQDQTIKSYNVEW